MVVSTESGLDKYFEWRGAVDQTVEVYCKLCNRVIFEIHEDNIQEGLLIAQQHWDERHGA